MTTTGVVSFKNATTVRTLKANYSTEMRLTIDFSLGQAGLHGSTNQYSIAGEVESDHPLPYEVWKNTSNTKLNDVVEAAKKARRDKGLALDPRVRYGEDNMPAITIPFSIHQPTGGVPNIKTTGGSQVAIDFRKQLLDKCNRNDIQGALEDIIQDYKDNGLLGATAIAPKYRASWLTVLDHYEAMAVITPAEKAALITKL